MARERGEDALELLYFASPASALHPPPPAPPSRSRGVCGKERGAGGVSSPPSSRGFSGGGGRGSAGG